MTRAEIEAALDTADLTPEERATARAVIRKLGPGGRSDLDGLIEDLVTRRDPDQPGRPA